MMSSRSVTAPAPLLPVPNPRQKAWQEMEYIAFAHFGVNTFTDREWGEGDEDPTIFNPGQLDARQWASVLKEAGIKMLILTAKHHDGFCLFPSRFTEHSIQNSPWRGGKGDVVKEVADACCEAGLKLGLYLSPWDRHEPTYGNSLAYNEYFKNQLGEILTRYGPITEVWFDGACGEGPNGKRQEYDWEGFYATVRRLQPEAVIFGGPDIRWVGNEDGVARETEWSVLPPPEGSEDPQAQWFPAECDVSIRPGWFYHAREDGQIKSLDHLLDVYFKSIGRNSVLLLNIPPDRRGLLHENDARRLIEFREAVEAIFKTDLARRAKGEASQVRGGSAEYAAGRAMDGHPDTYWAVDDGVTSAWLEVDLGKEASFNVARLEEPVSLGQRVQAYRIEAWDGAAWKEINRGTTVGYRKLDRFPTLTARKVRLVIEKSRSGPLIRTFGLYLDPRRKD
ncbi:MAG: alpha-L-fucosidase [Armatimonadetes bacterium]|nr:alpha-L-fucosidase [Armatimonadota bacterium]